MTTHQPAATARRQLLIDRFAEALETWGSAHAAERAHQLREIVEDLGYALPAALTGELPRPAASTPEGRARARLLWNHRALPTESNDEDELRARCNCGWLGPWSDRFVGPMEDHADHLAAALATDAPCAP